MKKIIRLFSVLSIVLTSCSNDDNVDFTSEDLIGNWQSTSVTYDGSATITVNGESSRVKITGESIDNSMSTRFNNDPKVLLTQGNFRIELTIDGGVGSIHYSGVQQLLTGDSWSQDGRTLRIYNGNEEESYRIDELLPNTMTLTDSRKESLEINGQITTVEFDLVAEYRKVN
ncbi:hypothetical protein F6U93_10065 [Tamlana haliotis]|uniref:Lipocalin-like domain-containing protein n=1 Tax=Pseudotamlana haliotis TaxID=2614804 RepID=A0A6N6MBN7_9FLAO|nr:hypothetical protein [Tamlana haliotis]KAB1067621.1 hypothetical protein F6U93_10065 [Tamlana haliotis]